jgi:coproporphyrinogen III oxidase-like Fe-S oxidoreductase
MNASKLEEPGYSLRLFVLLHHPIDHAIREYLEETKLPLDFKSLSSAENYYASIKYKENIHVRMLNGICNDLYVNVTKHHLVVAKEVLRQKFLVGIFERFSESLTRFKKYFGWSLKENDMDSIINQYCQSFVNEKGNSDRDAEMVKLHHLLISRNWADIELYQFAQVSL